MYFVSSKGAQQVKQAERTLPREGPGSGQQMGEGAERGADGTVGRREEEEGPRIKMFGIILGFWVQAGGKPPNPFNWKGR